MTTGLHGERQLLLSIIGWRGKRLRGLEERFASAHLLSDRSKYRSTRSKTVIGGESGEVDWLLCS